MNGAEESRNDRRDRARARRRHGMRVDDAARRWALLRRDALERQTGRSAAAGSRRDHPGALLLG